MPAKEMKQPALAGIKVVEFAHVIAGPLAGTLMADLGADVVHVEDPGAGDPGRTMGPSKDGAHLWWKVSGRNKRSVTINLREEEGQALAHDLVRWADVVITNVRVDTLARWRLDWKALHAINPRVVMLQITGNGADTSARNDPGFGKVGEARSGVVNITGFGDGPPVHTGFSHADSVTALMGAYAVSASLVRRHEPDFEGEWIDIALFESLFRLIEWQIICCDQLGVAPARAGNQLAVAPGAVINTYLSGDGVWITVTSGTPRSVSNIAELLGEPEEEYRTVADQLARKDRSTTCCTNGSDSGRPTSAWSRWPSWRWWRLASSPPRTSWTTPSMPSARTSSRSTIPTWARFACKGWCPNSVSWPGSVWRTGASLGQDNDLVYGEWLGKSAADLDVLRASGTI